MLTGSFAGQAVAWMLTYLLHSTLLLGLAWLASKPLSRWSVAAEEMVWKLALVGALFTASLQLAAGWQPLAGQWRLADLGGAAVTMPSKPVGAGLVPTRVEASSISAIPSHSVRAKSEALQAPPAAPTRSLPSIATLILAAWALGALVLLAAFGRSYLRLGRRLRSRPRVVGGDLHAQLRTLAAQAGLADAVRLSCSCRVPVPLAMGLREPEICVPPRALVSLTEEQQEGMLAHELAHLARRDPFWLVLGQGLACALFLQPLNWVARRRLREISEMLSDEWAVARTGRPLSLAGCLAEVAGWSVGSPALPVPSMADRPSSLGRRIRRLLDETRLPESPARRAWLAAAMGVLVIAVAAMAPAVSAARPEPLQPKKPAAPHVEVDVNDATDAPTARAAAEEDRDHGHHDHAQAMKDREADDEDAEPMVDADEIGDQVSESVDAALEGLDGELQALSDQHDLTQEQQEKLSRDMEKMSQDLQKNLNPRLEKLTRELSEKATHMAPSAEMQRLAQEMAKLGEQMRPSGEELAKLQALVDQEVRKHGSDGKLTAEERERIRRQAREMAEKMKPTEEQRRKMEELRAQMEAEKAKMGEDFRAANREEMEKLQREIHEEIEREMKGMRDELRREMDERKAIERQERKDRREQHHDAKPDHDQNDDSGSPKPPAKHSSGC
ncbi:MAG TPA: M56 family metallopeptidase [Thermoanaerobaculia bacterium]|jgi:beta-lactamase regulating signal transducer with metallopeptidase domain